MKLLKKDQDFIYLMNRVYTEIQGRANDFCEWIRSNSELFIVDDGSISGTNSAEWMRIIYLYMAEKTHRFIEDAQYELID